ncbi:MAG TPA: thiamine pyrophosphate-binding protein [Paludibacter sp.]
MKSEKPMHRVADYITEKLVEAGAKKIFLVTGGMIMHLTDAILINPDAEYICCHHEQAASMAAEAYGRYTNKLGVAYVTAGPAALNCLNSVVGAYVDRSPCVIVSGQSKVSQSEVVGPRQFALQGFNTLPIYKHATKYAVILNDISSVRYEVEKAISIATSHPFGPVWIECPIDIQGTPFDPLLYKGFSFTKEETIDSEIQKKIELVVKKLKESKRPCILVGQGVRLAGAVEIFNQLIKRINVPVITSRLGMDIMDHENPNFIGRPGTYGDRPANFTIQNSDLLIIIGCRLGVGLVGYNYKEFANKAFKVMIDVDEEELIKPSVVPDLPIKVDALKFIKSLDEQLGNFVFSNENWLERTSNWKKTYPVNLPEYRKETNGINTYHFINELSKKSSEKSIFVVDTGSCFHVHAQAFKVKYGQRHIITGGLSTMGYSPAANGVAAAAEGNDVYCITGDGSFQFNIQELQTIVQNDLPVKIIVFNNNGYLLIRLTQNNFLQSRYMGIDKASGVSFPDLKKISKAYGIDYLRVSKINGLDNKLDKLIDQKGPMICEVICPSDQLLIPRVASKQNEDGSMVSMPFDDMFPFLPREEYKRNTLND